MRERRAGANSGLWGIEYFPLFFGLLWTPLLLAQAAQTELLVRGNLGDYNASSAKAWSAIMQAGRTRLPLALVRGEAVDRLRLFVILGQSKCDSLPAGASLSLAVLQQWSKEHCLRTTSQADLAWLSCTVSGLGDAPLFSGCTLASSRTSRPRDVIAQGLSAMPTLFVISGLEAMGLGMPFLRGEEIIANNSGEINTTDLMRDNDLDPTLYHELAGRRGSALAVILPVWLQRKSTPEEWQLKKLYTAFHGGKSDDLVPDATDPLGIWRTVASNLTNWHRLVFRLPAGKLQRSRLPDGRVPLSGVAKFTLKKPVSKVKLQVNRPYEIQQ